jgi:hypothetical protein
MSVVIVKCPCGCKVRVLVSKVVAAGMAMEPPARECSGRPSRLRVVDQPDPAAARVMRMPAEGALGEAFG